MLNTPLMLLRILILLAILLPMTVFSNDVRYFVVDPLSGDQLKNNCSENRNIETVSVTAVINEKEPASFILCNVSDKPIVVKYEGVFLKDKSLISDVNVKYVLRWYQADSAWKSHWRKKINKAVLVPELLANDPQLIKVDHGNKKNYLKIKKNGKSLYVDISSRKLRSNVWGPEPNEFFVKDASELQELLLAPGELQQYWLTFNTRSISPGTHDGFVRLLIEGNRLDIPIVIKVLPFRFVRTHINHSIYYRGVLDPRGVGSISSDIKNQKQLEAEFNNLKEHGISNPTVYQPLIRRKKWKKYSSSLLNENFNNYLEIRSKAGFEGGDLYYLGFTTGSSNSAKAIMSIRKAFERLKSSSKGHGFDQVFLYGSDEAKGEKLLSQKKVWKMVKSEGGKILVAGSKGHVRLMGEQTDLLIHRDDISKDELDFMHSRGNKVYKYHDPKSGPEDPSLFRYKRGLHLWQKGFDGAMDYAYQHSMGFIWNDFDNKRYRDLAFTYPTIDGVIDTIAWEGYREGIDDLNYLATLECVLKIGQSDSSIPKGIYESARSYISNLKKQEEIDMATYRDDISSHIVSLLEWVHVPLDNQGQCRVH